MSSPTLIFYSVATLCLGLITVAAGGFRALALVVGLDPDGMTRTGVYASLIVASYFLFLAILFAIARARGASDAPQ